MHMSQLGERIVFFQKGQNFDNLIKSIILNRFVRQSDSDINSKQAHAIEFVIILRKNMTSVIKQNVKSYINVKIILIKQFYVVGKRNQNKFNEIFFLVKKQMNEKVTKK